MACLLVCYAANAVAWKSAKVNAKNITHLFYVGIYVRCTEIFFLSIPWCATSMRFFLQFLYFSISFNLLYHAVLRTFSHFMWIILNWLLADFHYLFYWYCFYFSPSSFDFASIDFLLQLTYIYVMYYYWCIFDTWIKTTIDGRLTHYRHFGTEQHKPTCLLRTWK